MTEQGHPPDQPERSGRSRAPQEPRRSGWQVLDDFDARQGSDSPPPWAGLGSIEPVRPARRPRPAVAPEPVEEPEPGPRRAPGRLRKGKSRAAAARRRRSRRRLVTWGGLLTAIALVAVGIYFLNQKTAPASSEITTLQRGEYASVPDSCKAVGAGTVSRYLPGNVSIVKSGIGSATNTLCAFNDDSVARYLNVTMQAYAPSLLAMPHGSATENAIGNYASAVNLLQHPIKSAGVPPARVTAISGLGQVAVSGVQVFHISQALTIVTVVVRFRNVLITIKLQGPGSGAKAVPVATLQAGAIAAARNILAAIGSLTPVGG